MLKKSINNKFGAYSEKISEISSTAPAAATATTVAATTEDVAEAIETRKRLNVTTIFGGKKIIARNNTSWVWDFANRMFKSNNNGKDVEYVHCSAIGRSASMVPIRLAAI